MLYLRLFLEYFYAGLFSVGGGLATIPFLQDMGARTGWFTSQELANMIAVSEATPGPMGVNMATYVGFTTGGPFGSVIATLAWWRPPSSSSSWYPSCFIASVTIAMWTASSTACVQPLPL